MSARGGGRKLASTSAQVATARGAKAGAKAAGKAAAAAPAGSKGTHGGSRGGGRPRKHPPKLPWRRITRNAKAGATEEEIVRGLQLNVQALNDPVTLTKFRDVIASGHAAYRLHLRQAIKLRGLRTHEGAGSVNALALQARNVLDWDSQIPAQETEPDLGTARQRLRDLIVRLAESRSQIEGRPVTPLELLSREAQADPEAPR